MSKGSQSFCDATERTARTPKFRASEVICGLANASKMCLLLATFDEGCTVWALWPPESSGFYGITRRCWRYL